MEDDTTTPHVGNLPLDTWEAGFLLRLLDNDTIARPVLREEFQAARKALHERIEALAGASNTVDAG